MSAMTGNNRTPPSVGSRASVALAAVFWSVYALLFFTRIPSSWSPSLSAFLGGPKRWGWRLIENAYAAVGVEPLSERFVSGSYLFLWAFAVPWLVMAVIGRGRPTALGWRVPNRLAWRLLLVSFVVAAPFQVWMVRSPQFAGQYMEHLRSGAAGFAAFYAVNMFAEHFLFHGVLLAAVRRDRCWPQPVPVAHDGRPGAIRFLQWLGMAAPTGDARGLHRMTRWFGLTDGCVAPIVVSGLLFGAVHVGKDPRELLLSIPGGIILGYIAYRTNSWLVPLGLHATTAGAACLLMLLMQPG